MAEIARGTERHSADDPGEGYRCRGCRLFDEWITSQPQITAALVRVGEACGVERTLVHRWRGLRRAPVAHRGTIQRITGIDVSAWDTWELLPGAEPASERRPKELPGSRVPSVPLAPERELESTEAELMGAVKQVNRLLEGGGLSPSQVAALQGKKLAALKTLAQLEARRGLHEHPEFDALVEDLLGAVLDELGPSAPPGTEARIADRFEARQAARARKAAA